MGVDYDGIGGVGIKVEGEVVRTLIDSGIFTEEEWEDDATECIEKLSITYSQAGNSYTGDECFYLQIKGETLGEVIANSGDFISKLKDFGIHKTMEELSIISDIHIW